MCNWSVQLLLCPIHDAFFGMRCLIAIEYANDCVAESIFCTRILDFSRIRPGRRIDFIEERPRRSVQRYKTTNHTPRRTAYNTPATTTRQQKLALPRILPRKVRIRSTGLHDRVIIKATPIAADHHSKTFGSTYLPSYARPGPDRAQSPCAISGSRVQQPPSSALHMATTRPPCAAARRPAALDHRRRPGHAPYDEASRTRETLPPPSAARASPSHVLRRRQRGRDRGGADRRRLGLGLRCRPSRGDMGG
jgi:hypothetical protein